MRRVEDHAMSYRSYSPDMPPAQVAGKRQFAEEVRSTRKRRLKRDRPNGRWPAQERRGAFGGRLPPRGFDPASSWTRRRPIDYDPGDDGRRRMIAAAISNADGAGQ